MKLYLKQHIFSWGDRFTVYDENGNDMYYVQGKVFSFGKKLYVYDRSNSEVAYIHEKVLSFLKRYYVSINGNDIAEIVKKITFFHPEYVVNMLGWTVSGDFFAHEYTVYDSEKTIASISKQWFTFGDAYEIFISDDADTITALSVVLAIDACISDARRSSN